MDRRKDSRILERRYTPGEVAVRSQGSKVTIEGYAAVFGKLSQNLGGFVEDVRHSAFTKTLQEADVRGVFNHDENWVLGRNVSETLELAADNSGLYYRILPPDTTYANDLLKVLERGDVSHSSFAFFTIEDEWGFTEQGFPLRSLVQVSLVDVGPVTYPAYLDATSGVNREAALSGLAKRCGITVPELTDSEAILRAVRGETTSSEESAGETTDDPVWTMRAKFARDLEKALTADSV